MRINEARPDTRNEERTNGARQANLDGPAVLIIVRGPLHRDGKRRPLAGLDVCTHLRVELILEKPCEEGLVRLDFVLILIFHLYDLWS